MSRGQYRPDYWTWPDSVWDCDCGRRWRSPEEGEYQPGYDNEDGIGLPDSCIGCRTESLLY